MDILGLAQLQRRIKDESQRKAKLKAREKDNTLGYRYHSTGDQYLEKKGDDKNKEYSLKFDPGATLRISGGNYRKKLLFFTNFSLIIFFLFHTEKR